MSSIDTPITLDELSKHNTKTDLWISILGYVYNLTDFLDKHPGGSKPLLHMAGKEATEYFMKIQKHHANILVPQLMVKYCIGTLKETLS